MDLIGLRLKEAFEKEGCPICRLLEEFEDSEIETILYEHVNDPEVRERFKKSLGLCTRHAWKVLQTSKSNPFLGPLGVATIYEHMLGLYILSLESERKTEEGECFLCQLLDEKEKEVVESVAERIENLMEIYVDGPALLCRRHYQMITEKLEPEKAKDLRKIQLKKLKELKDSLNEFMESFDYSVDRPAFRKAWTVERTIEALKGREVVSSLKSEMGMGRRRFWRKLR